MSPSLQNKLSAQIQALEDKIEDTYDAQREKFSYEIKWGKAVFTKEVKKLHKQKSENVFIYIFKARFMMILSAPIIYSIIIPILILDIWVTVYHWICFPIYKIKKVKRSDYIILDRHRLQYLNIIERVNCLYCAYVNGLIGYIREIAGRSEQYFCPIKHAKRMQSSHNNYKNFLDYGDYQTYKKELERLRLSLEKINDEDSK